MDRIERFLGNLKTKWKTILEDRTKPNWKAIWVFGMQKAGTSAIASLLANRLGKSATIDTPYLWQPYLRQLQEGELDLKEHVMNHASPFSKDIIKEPNASLLIPQIKSHFRLEKYIFIFRDPFDLIRSILNRLDLPGDKKHLNIKEIDSNWRHLFKNGENYIENLANHWVMLYSQYDYTNSRNCIFVRYEDFNKDKLLCIDNICKNLGLKPINDISDSLNKEFQPKGNSNVDLKLFYGNENYEIISKITYDVRKYYEV